MSEGDAPHHPQRLEIRLKCPNPIFENWLQCWLKEAERRQTKSQHQLQVALQSLRCYPLPLQSGRECAVLRGFGSTLCNLIDEELRQKAMKPLTNQINSDATYQKEVQQVAATVLKGKKSKALPNKAPKITKKLQRALAEEEKRNRQVKMSPRSFRILLLVDTQETSGKNKRTLDQTRSYLESLSLPYEVRRLTVGDFLWIARDEHGDELVLPYIVERKRMDDLASSIRDGRFHEQKHRLRHSGIQNVIYLVEDYGDNEHVGLPLESLQQAIANTQIQCGFNIAHSENNWRSMVYLQGMTHTLMQLFEDKELIGTTKENLQPYNLNNRIVGLLKFHELYEDSARNAQLTIREVFVQQLLQLHSLSMEKALALVEEYPTLRILFDAYEGCSSEQEERMLLCNIKSGPLRRPLGQKLSETLYEFFRTDF